MRLEIGGRVDCSDGTFGELADVVIDPTTKRVTHLVVKAEGQPSVERLVPIELADRGDGTRRVVTLRATAKEVGSLPPVQEVAYVQLGDFPLDDPDWDVGIELTNDRRLFERAVEAELREWRVYAERLRQRAAAKGGSAAERSQLALAELESRNDEVARGLREMRTASDETWRERRERVDAALDELEHAADAL